MARNKQTTIVSMGNGLYAKARKPGLAPSIFSIPAKIDRTEYCEQCRCYHDRPTWPAAHPYQGFGA